MSELTNGIAIEEDENNNVSGAQAEEGGGDEEENEATLLKKNLKLESQQAEEDAENKENADEKTEDQVPDITNEDPMTTSMDGIEEIANEPKETGDDEQQQPKENGEEKVVVEEENTEKDVAEIPVNIMDGDEEEKPPKEEEKEEQAEEPEEQKIEETPQEEAPKEEEESIAEKESFELQAPPVPKRPRTPNELDEPQQQQQSEGEEKSESEQQKLVQEEEPVEIPVEVTENGGGGGEAIEGGGKLIDGIIEFPRRESASKQSTIASPIPATPKSGATATPKSTRSGGRAFDFDSKKAAGKKTTTFEDEVLSVKSPKSRSSRSPRSPRTPKTPTSQVEEPKPEETKEQPKEAEDEIADSEAGKLAAEEEERQRQASFDERQKEREEEEDRFKRMTSWDRGEDGVPKEEPKEESISEQKEDTIAEDVEKESVKEESKAEESQQEEEPPAALESEAGEQPESKAEEPEEQIESKAEEPEDQSEEQEKKPSRDDLEGSPAPPPPRPERSPSPVSFRREPSSRDYLPYDQDLKAETKPARMPAGESFSSWTAADRDSYKPISPWVDRSSKYRNEYTVGEPPAAPTAYTAFFDDLAASGPFASSLYSTSRLLERSRSRTRERRHAMRSQSQARNYFRFASQLPAPLRSRDYSTPASSLISRAPTAGSSYTSFMDYAGAKQYDMARSQSLQRSPLYQSNLALSRSTSRGGIDYYLGTGRSSRVDSYVDSLHRPYDWNVPSNYEIYRSSNRGQVGFAPLSNYQSYVDTLQRSLSRERYERDRLRHKYTTVSYQLEQACKQMDLLRSSNYSALRSGSAPRTSVYAGFYPYN